MGGGWPRAGARRWAMGVIAAALAAGDIAAKAVVERRLASGRAVDLGILELRLAYNPGTAFSLGAGLPSWVIILAVGLLTVGVVVFAWREAPRAPLLLRLGLTGVLAGAIANLVDRIGDTVVTDYLYTRWWPTFNLADVFITVGAALIMLSVLRPERTAGT